MKTKSVLLPGILLEFTVNVSPALYPEPLVVTVASVIDVEFISPLANVIVKLLLLAPPFVAKISDPKTVNTSPTWYPKPAPVAVADTTWFDSIFNTKTAPLPVPLLEIFVAGIFNTELSAASVGVTIAPVSSCKLSGPLALRVRIAPDPLPSLVVWIPVNPFIARSYICRNTSETFD